MNCKIRVLMIILASLFTFISKAQKYVAHKKYNAKIYLTSKQKMTGYLYSINDSALLVAAELGNIVHIDTILNTHIRSIGPATGIDTIQYSEIMKIKFTVKGSGGTGYVAGTITSIVAGGVIGAAVSDGAGYAVLAGILGGLIVSPIIGGIGAAIGANSGKVFKIEHDQIRFQKMKEYLIKWKYLQAVEDQ